MKINQPSNEVKLVVASVTASGILVAVSDLAPAYPLTHGVAVALYVAAITNFLGMVKFSRWLLIANALFNTAKMGVVMAQPENYLNYPALAVISLSIIVVWMAAAFSYPKGSSLPA